MEQKKKLPCLTLKELSKMEADNNLNFLLLLFQRKQDLAFHVDSLLVDDLHEMPRLIFSEK